MKRTLLLSVFMLGAVMSAAQAQRDTTARIVGTASSAFNGNPLSGVMIAVPAARRFVVTDSTGRFELAGLPAGRQRIRVAYQGRETEEYAFDVRRGKTKTLAVVLDVEAVDLEPIVVEARYPDDWRNLAGFYARKKMYSGFAHFYTREDIERERPVNLRLFLAGQGIVTRCFARTGCVPTRLTRGELCASPVSVDGMPFWDQDYDQIPMDQVAGVEVYSDELIGPVVPFGVLPTFASFGQLGQAVRGCGSIEIWTR
jgi:hypothetical protein